MAENEQRTPKVLVVDDDPRLRDLLRRYFGENGFSVSVAENGQAMNRIWLRERFDALILDLMMPGEDGLQILRRLRAGKDMTPVIMLTARGEDVDRIVGLELGADDYIAKPFNPRELLARIHAVLRRRPAKDQPGAPSKENIVVRFGDRFPATNSWKWPAAASTKPLTGRLTFRSRAFVSSLNPIPPSPVICRRSGVLATSLFPTIRLRVKTA